jgi:phosphatidylserine/phosphatidylglycerophosphate/cardiolipin synthase-like enzyme/uncharacterized membrane protein YdjX (TVP38/TMEM64 family)
VSTRNGLTLAASGHAQSAHAPASADSIFQPLHNCFKAVRADRAALLVDADDYFRAFVEAAAHATESIIILAWDFDSRTELWRDDVSPKRATTLGAFLNALVRRRRRLRVYVLDWDYPMIFGTDREFPPLYGLGWKPARRVRLHYDNTHPVAGSHHQKIVVIDDAIAFSGGLDLTSRRWDTCEHRADDPRRVANGMPYPPFHDLMAAVDGEAARVLGEIARERWRRATGASIPAPRRRRDLWPANIRAELTGVTVGVSRTVPEREKGGGVREVEQLFFDMIARARRHIVIENQYFTANRVGEALAARLAERDGPEIVLVLRLLSHGWLEEHTMEALRTRLINRLRAADRWQRFRVYYPHVPGLKEGTCVDVHSKMMAVDDEWLRIGSANICNRSMGFDTECDLTFEASGNERIAAAIRGFRNRLLAEHLGTRPGKVEEEIARAGSINGAIAALQGDGRTLKYLEAKETMPAAVVDLVSVADPEQPVSLDKLINEFSPKLDTESGGPAWFPIALAAVVLAGLAAAWRFTPLADLITAERVMTLARDFAGRPWAPFIVLAAYTPASVIMFPRPLITLAAVVAFGAWLGFAYAMGGILIAAVASYVAGRMLDRETVRRLAGARLNQVSEKLRERGLLAVTALRLVPMAPFAVEGLVAGAVRIKLWHLTLGTFIGMLPGTLATTVFGNQLEAALRDPAEINYWLLAGIVVVLGVGVLVVRRWLFKPTHPRAAQ